MADILERCRDLNILEMEIKVFIAGQKQIALELFKRCLNSNLKVMGCCCPKDDKYLRPYALNLGVNVVTPDELNSELLKDIDIGFCAHYFGKIGNDLIRSARLGWLGYHPSLLPLHKGKNSIIDTIKSGDKVVGGSLYWLSSGMDEGDIAYQDFKVVDKSIYTLPEVESARKLWINYLSPLGLSLFDLAILDIKRGVTRRIPQKQKYAG